VVAGLVELGFGAITVAARRPEALAAFAQTCGPWAPQLIPLAWGDLDSATDNALAQADLVVNTTPIGMAGAKDPAGATDPAALKACPLNSAQLDQLRPGATVYDLIYTPRPTQLLRQAAPRLPHLGRPGNAGAAGGCGPAAMERPGDRAHPCHADRRGSSPSLSDP